MKTGTQRILYLRHGQTEWNRKNLCVGQVDVPLNALGRQQALVAATSRLLDPITAIISSPLSRAAETARTVGEATGLQVDFNHDLRECSLGVLEGVSEDDETMFEPWLSGETPENAESWLAFSNRVSRAVSSIAASNEYPLVVAHSAVLWAIKSRLGLPICSGLENGSFMELSIPNDFLQL